MREITCRQLGRLVRAVAEGGLPSCGLADRERRLDGHAVPHKVRDAHEGEVDARDPSVKDQEHEFLEALQFVAHRFACKHVVAIHLLVLGHLEELVVEDVLVAACDAAEIVRLLHRAPLAPLAPPPPAAVAAAAAAAAAAGVAAATAAEGWLDVAPDDGLDVGLGLLDKVAVEATELVRAAVHLRRGGRGNFHDALEVLVPVEALLPLDLLVQTRPQGLELPLFLLQRAGPLLVLTT